MDNVQMKSFNIYTIYMIIYVIGFTLVLILYYNLFKIPIIKEGLNNSPIYTITGELVNNCDSTNYKKDHNGKDAYACPRGNCFDVYGRELFNKDGVPAPNQEKLLGKCCPYVYKGQTLDYTNKNTCDECGYMFWNISSTGDLEPSTVIKQCLLKSGSSTTGSGPVFGLGRDEAMKPVEVDRMINATDNLPKGYKSPLQSSMQTILHKISNWIPGSDTKSIATKIQNVENQYHTI